MASISRMIKGSNQGKRPAPYQSMARRLMKLVIGYGIGSLSAALAGLGLLTVPALAADSINGQVHGAGAPIAGSTITLWAEDTDGPTQLAQTQTDGDGRFVLNADGKGA